MAGGRPPKPTRLKILQGNPGKRPLNAHEPKPEGGAPKCPKWLTKEAKAEWRRIVPELERMGMVTRIDLGVLAAYCQAFGEMEIAARTIEKEGRTRETSTGFLAVHPAVTAQRQSWQAVRQLSERLGLDPSSRVRLSVAPPNAEKDEFEEFLRGAQ